MKTNKKMSSDGVNSLLLKRIETIERMKNHLNAKLIRINAKLIRKKWTLKECIKDAAKYKSLREWEKNSRNAHQASRRNNWFEECSVHMEKGKPKSYWTKEKCIADAKKYKTRSEWKNNSYSSYVTSVRNKWLDKCCSHMQPVYRKPIYGILHGVSKYNSLEKWKIVDPKSYNKAKNKGLLKDICKVFGWEYTSKK